jgi:hypothetical protein
MEGSPRETDGKQHYQTLYYLLYFPRLHSCYAAKLSSRLAVA